MHPLYKFIVTVFNASTFRFHIFLKWNTKYWSTSQSGLPASRKYLDSFFQVRKVFQIPLPCPNRCYKDQIVPVSLHSLSKISLIPALARSPPSPLSGISPARVEIGWGAAFPPFQRLKLLQNAQFCFAGDVGGFQSPPLRERCRNSDRGGLGEAQGKKNYVRLQGLEPRLVKLAQRQPK